MQHIQHSFLQQNALWTEILRAKVTRDVVKSGAAQLKHLVTSSVIRAVELTVESVGNSVLLRDYALERHFPDMLRVRIHTPQDGTILVGAGRSAFDAFSAPQQKQERRVSLRSEL